MIRNIVFDMGGVLLHWRPEKAYENASKEDGELLYRAVCGSPDWRAFDHGDFDEAGMIARAKSRLPERLHEDAVRLVRWYEPTDPVDGMESLTEELKHRGFSLYLLSNTSEAFHRFRTRIPALRHFTGEFISADCHLLKPDPAIFGAFLKAFGLQAEESLFIDDSPPNAEGAETVGMDALVFTDALRLRGGLREKGIL